MPDPIPPSTDPSSPQPRTFDRSGFVAVGLVVLALMLVIGVMRFVDRPGGRFEPIPWQTNLDRARELAAQTGTPVFIDFFAAWCAPCQTMNATVFTNPDVARMIESHFVPVRIDVTQAVSPDGEIQPGPIADLWRQFDIKMLPTMIVVDPRGQEQYRHVGVLTAKDMLAWLDATAKGGR